MIVNHAEGGPPSKPEEGPALVLPERAALDPVSAAALAIMEKLDPMIAQIDAPVAIDVRELARAALDAVAQMPSIPPWEGPRAVGGATRTQGLPEPELTVDLDGAAVLIRAAVAEPPERDGLDARGTAQIAPADARAWALAVLAACAMAEAFGPYVTPEPDPVSFGPLT